MQYLSVWDLLLTPIYLIILSVIAKRHRDKYYPPGNPLRKFYMPGLFVKFGGAIFIALIYQFYYGGGDTFNYFHHARVINSSLNDSIELWIKLLFRTSPDADPRIYSYSSQMYWYVDPPAYTTSAIAAVFGIFNGTTYIPIALMFAFLSYTGIWAMFKTFVGIYPLYYKQLAIAFLFIPSTFVWGSPLFKDTICMFALGWMTYCTFRIFINRDLTIKNFFLLILGFYLVATIKVYILMAFVPALSLWLLMSYSKKVKSVGLRWMINLAFIGITIAGFLYFTDKFAQELNEYSLENIAAKAQKTQGWITYVSEAQEGSGYDIGTFEPTIQGMLTKFPQGVMVTLYRPFLWEARKPIVLLSALEAVCFLVLTFLIFYRKGVGATFKMIFRDPNLTFFLIYTLIFAFAVGVSTGNFGTLSRYKIPCMPFFAALILILYYSTKITTHKPSTHAIRNKKPVHHIA